MKQATCPNDDTLRGLLAGEVSGEQAQQLEAHLSTCDSCVATAASLAEVDDLAAALKQYGELAEPDESVSELIQRLKVQAAHHDSLNTHIDETANHPGKPLHAPTQQLPPSEAANAARLTSQGTPSEEFAFLDPPEQPDELGRLGRYRILGKLGQGGMGVVLKAEDPKLRRLVAIKVLSGKQVDRDEGAVRFLREAQATAAIEHDNIVSIYDVGEHRGMPYYAMQMLQGESLAARLRREGKLPLDEAERIATEIAAGLAAAHSVGLLHRDIKPANVWLEEGTGRVKVVDFGLARLTDGSESVELTMSGALVGTPRFMSPEQAQGMPVDARSDLFSLGSVLYQMLSGKPAFAGENITSTLIAVASKPHLPLSEVNPETPPEFATVVDRLLEKKPSARYESAEEVITALSNAHAASDSTIRLHPGPLTPSTRRPNRPLWIATAAAVPLLLLGVILFWRTPKGDLRVEVNDPNVQVVIDGEQLTITDQQWKGKKKAGRHRLKLKLGKQEVKLDPEAVFTLGDDRRHRVSTTLNGTQLSSNEFEVVRGQESVLSIRLIPATPTPEPQAATPPIATPIKTPPPDPRRGDNQGYDSLATGKWLNLFELQPPKPDGKFVHFENGVLELRGVNLKFPAVAGRNMLLRARVKKASGHDVAIKVRSQDKFGGYLAWINERYRFGLGVDKPPKPDSLFSRTLNEPISTDRDGFCELALAAIDDRLQVYVNGKQIVDVTDPSYTQGVIELGTFLNGRGFFKDVQVMRLDDNTAYDRAKPMSDIAADGVILPDEGWADIMSLVDIKQDAVRHNWTADAQGLHCPSDSAARLRLPVAIDGAYELEADVTHRTGDAGPIFILPVGDHGVCAYLACNHNRIGVISGLSLVNGSNPKSNPTPQTAPNTLGQRVKVRLRVEPGDPHAKITMWKNDNLYREWTLQEDSLSIDNVWKLPGNDQAGIGSSGSNLLWHGVRLKMLKGQASLIRRNVMPLRQGVDLNQPTADGKTIAPEDGWVGLLSTIDLKADSEEGGWRRDERGIVRVEDDASTLRVPVEIHGNYQLRIKFLRDDDEKSGQGLVLPIGPPPYTVHPQFFSFGDYHGLSVIRGHRITSNSNPTKRKLVRKANHEYEALLKVIVGKDDSVEITCHLDGEELYTFQGLLKDLSPTSPQWLHNHIALRSGGIPGARWTKLELRMLDGHAKLLRQPVVDHSADTKLQLELVREARANVAHSLYSPDGKQLISVRWGGGEFEVRDAETGDVVRLSEPTDLIGSDNFVVSMAVSPVAPLAAAGTSGGRVVVCNYETGELLHTYRGDTGWVNELCFSPDGKRLYAINTVGLMVLPLGEGEKWRTLVEKNGRLRRTTISPDGERLAYVIANSLVMLNAETEKTLWTGDLPGGPGYCGFSADGSQLVVIHESTGHSLHARFFDTTSGEVIKQFPLPGTLGLVNARLFANARYLLMALKKDGLFILSTADGSVVAHRKEAKFGDVSPDGKNLVTWETGLQFWQLSPSRSTEKQSANESPHPVEPQIQREVAELRLNRELPAPDGKISCLAVSPDGKTLVAGLADGRLQWFDLTGEQKPQTTASGSTYPIVELWFDPAGERLFVEPRVSARDGLQMWNVAERKKIHSLPQMVAFAMSPDGSKLIGHSEGSAPKLLDGESLAKLALPPALSEKKLKTFAFLPDNHLAATTMSDDQSRLLIVNLATGEVDHDVQFPDRSSRDDIFMDAGTTRDGKFALFARRYGGIDAFDPAAGKFVSFFQQHTGDGKISRHFTVGGGALFTFASRLGVVHPQTGQIKELANRNFFHATLTPDGRQLIAVNRESKLNVWDVLYFPPLNQGNHDSSDAANFRVPTGGLSDEQAITPEGDVPPAWQHGDVFAEIKGKGELQFPRLDVTEFALDLDITVRDANSDLLIAHRAPHDRWRSEVRLAHTEPDDNGKLLRVLPIRRRGGQFFMPGHTNAPIGERFKLTLAFSGDALCLYINGQRRLGQKEVQPDLRLTLAALSDTADATIHQLRYRPLNRDEQTDLGLDAATPNNDEIN